MAPGCMHESFQAYIRIMMVQTGHYPANISECAQRPEQIDAYLVKDLVENDGSALRDTLDKLSVVSAPRAHAVRDGQVLELQVHELVQDDVMRWIERHGDRYDLIFCDPPTFSNSKRADDFDVQRDHPALLRAAVARLAPGGLLLFSNNFRRFRLDEAAISAFATVQEISADTLDPDFERNPRIHRTWEVRQR